jgi:hypothetical protein
MRARVAPGLLLMALLLAPVAPPPTPLAAQSTADTTDGQVGTVHFATSCDPALQADFDRAVAMYHSFWFEPSRRAFAAIAEADPTCGIAYWGIALDTWGNPFAVPNPRIMLPGAGAAEQAAAIGAQTPRERDYIAAVGELYRDWGTVDAWTRLENYQQAMERVYRAYPDDREAAIFYALSLAFTTPATDKTYANSLRAAQILEALWPELPDHPGIPHYLIHSYDYPPLAEHGLTAARLYAGIAPAAPHAQHMPSHTFTRLGYWDESIAANLASEAAETVPTSRLHPMDYLTYAYLQEARDGAAAAVLGDARALPDIPAPTFANAYALAAIPARYALERGRWADAAVLTPQPGNFAWNLFPAAEAITTFASALGAARGGDAATALEQVQRLAALRDAVEQEGDVYWTEQVDLQRQVALAWATLADGRGADALALMEAAAAQEDTTEKSAVTPGPIVPARELLGEMLLLLNQPQQALAAFERSQRAEPNRFRGLAGAARAAALAGDGERASRYYTNLLALAQAADSDRPELQEARTYLGR